MKNITPLIFLLFSFIGTLNITAQRTQNPNAMMLSENRSITETPSTLSIDDKSPATTFNESKSPSKNEADTTAPVFETGFPFAENAVRTSFTLKADIDEAGTIYYVSMPDGFLAPTSAEVKAGTGSGGFIPTQSGNQSVPSGDFSHDFVPTGLSANTSYDIYVVAEDDEASPNLQASPTLVEVTTSASNALFTIADTSVTEGDSGSAD